MHYALRHEQFRISWEYLLSLNPVSKRYALDTSNVPWLHRTQQHSWETRAQLGGERQAGLLEPILTGQLSGLPSRALSVSTTPHRGWASRALKTQSLYPNTFGEVTLPLKGQAATQNILQKSLHPTPRKPGSSPNLCAFLDSMGGSRVG